VPDDKSSLPVFDFENYPRTYRVGTHSLVLAKLPGSNRWTLTVDGTLSASTFETEAEAWEEGVRIADWVDRAAAKS
jgi:hypothetical protein